MKRRKIDPEIKMVAVLEGLRGDGSEFTAKAVQEWLSRVGVKTLYNRQLSANNCMENNEVWRADAPCLTPHR
jgi:hypothetical protein